MKTNKKEVIVLIGLLIILTSTNLFAANYEVIGAGTDNANGVYEENGTFNDHPKYENTECVLYYGDCDKWLIGYDTQTDNNYYQNETNSDTPPETDWERCCSGATPAPTVIEAGASLSYSSDVFYESVDNDGTIQTIITITYNNYGAVTFTGLNGDDFVDDGKVLVTNIPSGFTVVINRTSSLELSATLNGVASNPTHTSDVSNLTFDFQNSAFSSGDASEVANANKSDLQVNFRDLYTVASSGGDYSTIASAISSVDGSDILELAAETFTEAGLTIDKNLVIIGRGTSSTIIQAHAVQASATDNVFDINSGLNVVFKNLTIQNGNNVGEDGGGINADASYIEIDNCIVTNNSTEGNSSGIGGRGGGICCDSGTLIITDSNISGNSSLQPYYSTSGGGVFITNDGSLEITNTTISGNTSNARSGASGGGLYTAVATTISNSTISGNTVESTNGSESFGGGICCTYYLFEITNSTVSGNSVTTAGRAHGGGIHSSGSDVDIKNSTISGNTITGGHGEYGDGLCCYNRTSSLTIGNTILANNGEYDYCVVYPTITITDNGYNIIENSNIGVNDGGFDNANTILYNTKYNTSSISETTWTKGGSDLGIQTLNLLSTLADNGTLIGTQTLAISSPSFAIDNGLYDIDITTDQRGLFRNNPPTIGAYEYEPITANLWTGTISTDWNTAANWEDGDVPTSTNDVTIPAECSNYPAIDEAAVCKGITIEDGGSVQINVSCSLNVTGDFTLEDGGSFINNGTLQFSGSDCHLTDNRTTKTDLGNISVN